jgi:hypothetical protein
MAVYAKVLTKGDGDWWPFWYGERPLIGFLTAAIWAKGGIAIEEFAADKRARKRDSLTKPRLGRGDLYFRIGRREGNVEFKMHYVGITRARSAAQLRKLLDDKWENSKKDAARLKGRVPKFGAIILRPYIGKGRDIRSVNANLRDLLQESWNHLQPEVVAWWCPTKEVIEAEEEVRSVIIGAILVLKKL